MKEITLTQGYVAKVDDCDFEAVSQFKWCARDTAWTVYAHRTVRINGKKTTQIMHRFILNLKDPTIQVDHINHDGLDNRRENLRSATNTQNQYNQRVRRQVKSKSSAFKGVSWNAQCRKWQAYITPHGKRKHVGLFQDENLAAAAYDAAALKFFGEFALTNAEIARRDWEAA